MATEEEIKKGIESGRYTLLPDGTVQESGMALEENPFMTYNPVGFGSGMLLRVEEEVAKKAAQKTLSQALKGTITESAGKAEAEVVNAFVTGAKTVEDEAIKEFVTGAKASAASVGGKVKDVIVQKEGGWVKIAFQNGGLKRFGPVAVSLAGIGILYALVSEYMHASFILEETGQQYGLAAKTAIDAGDNALAQRIISDHEAFLKSKLVELGSAAPQYAAFFSSQRQQIDANKALLKAQIEGTTIYDPNIQDINTRAEAKAKAEAEANTKYGLYGFGKDKGVEPFDIEAQKLENISNQKAATERQVDPKNRSAFQEVTPEAQFAAKVVAPQKFEEQLAKTEEAAGTPKTEEPGPSGGGFTPAKTSLETFYFDKGKPVGVESGVEGQSMTYEEYKRRRGMK